MSAQKPLVLVSSNRLDFMGTKAHMVRDSYIKALSQVADVNALIIPADPSAVQIEQLLSIADGLLLTGSASHVAPSCYGAKQEFEDTFIDSERDKTTLPLIQSAIDADLPIFAICRGFQELNVVCGGTLHQYVHQLPGKHDHRHNADVSLQENYEKEAHTVTTQKGGLFEKLGLAHEFFVNTLHTQGADRIGKGLRVEAISDDGLVEAFSMPEKAFVVGTQWHPEGNFHLSESSRTLFKAFGEALRRKAEEKTTPPSKAANSSPKLG